MFDFIVALFAFIAIFYHIINLFIFLFSLHTEEENQKYQNKLRPKTKLKSIFVYVRNQLIYSLFWFVINYRVFLEKLSTKKAATTTKSTAQTHKTQSQLNELKAKDKNVENWDRRTMMRGQNVNRQVLLMIFIDLLMVPLVHHICFVSAFHYTFFIIIYSIMCDGNDVNVVKRHRINFGFILSKCRSVLTQ